MDLRSEPGCTVVRVGDKHDETPVGGNFEVANILISSRLDIGIGAHEIGKTAAQVKTQDDTAPVWNRRNASVRAGLVSHELTIRADRLIVRNGIAGAEKRAGIRAGPSGCSCDQIANVDFASSADSRHKIRRGAKEGHITPVGSYIGRFRTP